MLSKFKEVLFEPQGGVARDRAHQIAVGRLSAASETGAEPVPKIPREYVSGDFLIHTAM